MYRRRPAAVKAFDFALLIAAWGAVPRDSRLQMLLSATSDAGACHVIHSCAEEDISWKTDRKSVV